MFKHPSVASPEIEPKANASTTAETETRELLEKNLKWSQILYEQNRKIKRKLSWLILLGWARFLIIAIPLVLALWFLPPLIRSLSVTYGNFFKDLSTGRVAPDSIRQFMKFAPPAPALEKQFNQTTK